MTLAQYGTGENLTMKPETKADLFCGLILTSMGGYDIYALMQDQETISACVRRHTEKPYQKFLMTGFMASLLVHFLLPPINLERTHHDQA